MEKGFLDWFLDNYFSLRSSRVDLSCLLSFFFVAATRLSPITKMADLAFLIFMPGRQFHDMPKWTACRLAELFFMISLKFSLFFCLSLIVREVKMFKNPIEPPSSATNGNAQQIGYASAAKQNLIIPHHPADNGAAPLSCWKASTSETDIQPANSPSIPPECLSYKRQSASVRCPWSIHPASRSAPGQFW